MHEMGIALEVARLAREAAAAEGAPRVVSLRLRVGRWAGVEPESLRFALETLASTAEPGDALLGCRLDLERVEPEFACPACGERYCAEGYLEPCPACGGLGADLVAGDELSLTEIEVEER